MCITLLKKQNAFVLYCTGGEVFIIRLTFSIELATAA